MFYPLMNFRLSYLRAIATAWTDKEFEDVLINAKDKENPPDVLDPDVQKEHLVLKDIFGDLQLGHISLYIFDDENDRTEWNKLDSGKWIGSDDYFIINLPCPPLHKEERVEALAAYYQLFPTLFGSLPPDQESKPIFTDKGGNPDPFLQFGIATLHAIALAWKDESVFSELTDPDLEDANHVLSKYVGFLNPWNFNIQFRRNEDFKWKKPSWTKIPKNIIRLHYPCRPSEDLPIALADYNTAEPQYPFTCH